MAKMKPEETFNENLNSSEAFFMKYKKQALIVLGLVVLLLCGYFAYNTYVSAPKENEASTLLGKNQQLFNTQQYDAALKGFQQVQSDYSGTTAGNLANLYIGLCYAHLQKPDWKKALEYVEKYKTSNDQIISPASQMAMGDIYANNNQNDKAIASFKKAAEMSNSSTTDGVSLTIAPIALKKAAIILESEGKNTEALAIYENIKKDYKNSPIYREIDKYIERASK